MGVSSTTNTEIYAGNGVSVSFPFPFYFFALADLYVYIYDTIAGTITLQVLSVDYTISGTPNAQGLYPSGANVIMGAAPSATKFVVISRTPIETQNYALLVDGQISSVALVQQFDYLTLLVQSLQDQINRCVQLPPGFAPAFNPDLPAVPVATEAIVVNGANNGLAFAPFVAGPTGPTGPTGPAGPAGSSGAVVNPASVSTALVAGSPIDQQYIPCDATAGIMNITLPAANLAAIGQIFQIKQVDASGNAITILPNGGDQILTTVLVASLTLDYRGKSYSLICRAVGIWDVI